MGDTNKKYAITASSGTSASIAASAGRDELLLRNAGPNTVYLAFNEAAIDSAGFYLESGDALILTKTMASRAIYFVTASGETATVYAELEG